MELKTYYNDPQLEPLLKTGIVKLCGPCARMFPKITPKRFSFLPRKNSCDNCGEPGYITREPTRTNNR